eukprot:CAMPEP_0197015250 /NCGR_PEP_ID=MMETSP1380-20130617/73476_1 /TAXON_ID=5936 /ORGANISM="Euplotes crassus, Strain CT5" /LENGTH=186 /DNA_ID=CAMNT_0042441019 /DNA_START=130 /DNA_END=690 /DNA_ORIENTATION=-
MGKLVEVGFSDIITKCKIIKENREKWIEKGEEIKSVEQLFEVEISYGLGQANGSNNKSLGFDKKSEFYKHIGSCRSIERLLRFILLLQRIIENLHANKEESLSSAVRKAYDQELSRYHSFFLRNTVKGIFYLLPKRETFLKSITDDFTQCKEDEIEGHMKTMIDTSEVVTSYLIDFMKEQDHFELP